jgi:hypothetical protein
MAKLEDDGDDDTRAKMPSTLSVEVFRKAAR